MSMLSRYKKSGGFVQLLKLIEGFGVQKQEKFLTLIEQENSLWSQALRDKMISMDKVLEWNEAYLSEVTTRVPELTIALAMAGLKEEQKEKLFKVLSFTQRRSVDEILAEKTPTPAEIGSANLKILNAVRDMISTNAIRIDNVDPSLAIKDDIEERLNSGKSATSGSDDEASASTLDFSMADKLSDNDQIRKLQTKAIKLGHENLQLKKDLQILKDKLTQIKKIA